MFRMHLARSKFSYDWYSLFNLYRLKVNDKSQVLEIGASTRDRTLDLAKSCATLIGVEVFQERIPPAEGNIVYKCADWQELSSVIPENSIDVAVASHVIEHVQDDLKAVNELYRVLRPGGVGLLSTPNRLRLTRRIIELFAGQRKFPFWEHVREYSEDDVTKLLTGSQFTKWQINGLVFGLHGGPLLMYFEKPPGFFRKMSNFWEIVLIKEDGS